MQEIIGVDVGNGYTKTRTSCFESAVDSNGEVIPEIKDGLLEYNGLSYYVGSGKRTKTKTDNKTDETQLVLCLAGIATELKQRGLHDAHIILAEGLPIGSCDKKNKEIDQTYYKKGEELFFRYEKEDYHIIVDDVLVYPQCVAGIYSSVVNKTIPDSCMVIDVGSWTTDILTLDEYKPRPADSKSINMGIITCINKCQDEIRKRTGFGVREKQIIKIMLGEPSSLTADVVNIVTMVLKDFCKDLKDTITEMGENFNVDQTACVFMGGGATMIKRFGSEHFKNAKYITNIHANAIGYEQITNEKRNKNMEQAS